MNTDEIKQVFEATNAIRTNGHFGYTQGDHGEEYVNKDTIYAYPTLVARLCEEMVERFVHSTRNVDVVVGPEKGAIILSTWTAYHLSNVLNKDVHSVYADKKIDTKKFVIQRGYDEFVRGKRVLIVEDILNTGGSGLQIVETVRETGGIVVGFAALCNRGGVTKEQLTLDDNVAFFSLLNIHMKKWKPADCPMCKAGIPLDTRLGTGKK